MQAMKNHLKRNSAKFADTLMSRISQEILESPIEYLKGVGPHRADMLRKELRIGSFRDMLELYPYRHIDKIPGQYDCRNKSRH